MFPYLCSQSRYAIKSPESELQPVLPDEIEALHANYNQNSARVTMLCLENVCLEVHMHAQVFAH